MTKEHIQLLKNIQIIILFCYDNDKAGFSASVRNGKLIAQTIRDMLNENELKSWKATEKILFTKLPSDYDPNDLFLKNKEELNQQLNQPLQYLDYCKQMCSENPSYQTVFEETIKSEQTFER